ncbi:sensor histidine kinase [Actinocorallia longicatena]|uniref:histidine kinase n=1 Tax=Actinocorallia longicatena TaxID=111803 RepID=A0ABP6QJ84_9ACTN
MAGPRWGDTVLPGVLVGLQLVLGRALLPEDPGGSRWAAAGVAAVVMGGALAWRRTAPVIVLAVVAAVGAAAHLAFPEAASGPVFWLSDAIALYSLAVLRDARTAAAGLAAVTLGDAVSVTFSEGIADLPASLLVDALVFVLVVQFGRAHRARGARRAAATARLAEIEQEERAAAAAERERLARDLHDVAGHHLSAVAVHSGAAARDPELVEEALAIAIENGREVLAALEQLVGVVGPEPGSDLDELLPPLCEGLGRLGFPVMLRIEGDGHRLPPATAAVLYRVVQESLTNAMRYASGQEVSVVLRHGAGGTRVTVVNGVSAGAPPRLGGGRGVAGMTARVEGLGGRLEAGQDGAGSWVVVAEVPRPAAVRRWPRADPVLAAVLTVVPLVLALGPPEPLVEGVSAGFAVLLAVLLGCHALPLVLRARLPVAAAVLSAAASLAWPVLTLAGVLAPGWAQPLVFAWGVELILVYGAGPAAVPVLAAASMAAVGAAAYWEPGEGVGALVFYFAVFCAAAAAVLAPFRIWGLRARSAEERIVLNEESARRAIGAVTWTERQRLAAGLRGTVLTETAGLVSVAEAAAGGAGGDPREAVVQVARRARAALTGMRDLLEVME